MSITTIILLSLIGGGVFALAIKYGFFTFFLEIIGEIFD